MPSDAHERPFRGFPRPQYTRVPDVLFDELLPDLSGAELKVLLYICRRTFGFNRDADTISQSQLEEGILTRDGRRLDRGTGLSRDSIWRALRSLREKGMIVAERRFSPERGDEATSYGLRFLEPAAAHTSENPETPVPENQGPPVSEFRAPASPILGVPRARKSSTQETGDRETGEGVRGAVAGPRGLPVLPSSGRRARGSSDRSGSTGKQTRKPKPGPDPLSLELREDLEPIARALGDQAPLAATLARATNLMHRAKLESPVFREHLAAAARLVEQRRGRVRAGLNRMPYFFAILEQLVGLRPVPEGLQIDQTLYERPEVSAGGAAGHEALQLQTFRALLYRAEASESEESRAYYREQAEELAAELPADVVASARREVAVRLQPSERLVAEEPADYDAVGE